jgi:DNA-directed RNA polymerase specialized sigma24 family protein
MDPQATVTFWIDQLKAGKREAAQPLWERYVHQLVHLARKKLGGAARATADEEDVVLSAFNSFFLAAEQGRFPQLADRDDLWRLLVVITERKAINQVRDQQRQKRGGGKVLGEAALATPASGSTAGGGLGQVPGPEPTPDFAVMVAEECQALLDALGDEVLRRVALAKLEGHSNEEIGRRLGIAMRTVERKLGLIRQVWEGRQEGP